MGTSYDHITDKLRTFIEAQHMYFVATAARNGRVNVSPKGLDSFRILSPQRVLWINGTGSTNETAAHVLDSPRMTLMFCAFDGQPLIVRLYGTARTVHEGDSDWDELSAHFGEFPGARNIFDVELDLVQGTCGFGVPLYEFQDQRDLLPSWASKRTPEMLRAYREEKNQISIDGLPTGLPVSN